MTTKKLLSLAFAFFIASFSANATTQTLAEGNTVNSSSNPFGGLSSGDTILIHGTFNLNSNYSTYSSTTIVMIIDGSNASIHWAGNNDLSLGSGSSLIIMDGGAISNSGSCNGAKNIYFGGTKVAVCNGAGGLPSFGDVVSAGGIDASGNPLPVSWLSVDASSTASHQAVINWATASEENNSYFEVEYSLDGATWITAGFEQSKAADGTSQSVIDYSFTHSMAETSASAYYRIKQVDFNGDFDYSPIVRVNFETSKKLNIATLGNLSIRVNTGNITDENSTLKVYDLSGREVYQSEKLNEVITFDQPGVFVIELHEGNSVQRVKHVVR
ncbi:hypothetical protein GYB22_03670 [bacterium]|nr:hypothetical protein [bacterium]